MVFVGGLGPRRISKYSLSRFLQREKLTSKRGRRVAVRQNRELHLAWIASLVTVTTEQIAAVDESNLNEATGWRQGDRRRGKSWSVLPAYTVDGYLTVGIKEGYVNRETFFRWVVNELLPHCNAYPVPRSVIITDIATFHCNLRQHGIFLEPLYNLKY